MLKIVSLFASASILSISGAAIAQHHSLPSSSQHSPYVEQLNSPVRGLSAQEVDDLANGRGAGYARTAELNSFPGPRHTLDLKQELNLSAEQEAAVQAEFEQMQAEAKRVGQEILTREQQLTLAFVDQTITAQSLETQTQQLATLYGELRMIHLKAHLNITPLLSPEQIERYNELRGYGE